MKSLLMLILVLLIASVGVWAQEDERPRPPRRDVTGATAILERPIPPDALKNTGILIVIAPKNFNDDEFKTSKEVFEKHGAKVDVVSTKEGEALGMKGTSVKIEKTISGINPDDYDAVVFVGGAGTKEIWDNKSIKELAVAFNKGNKVIGAICLAPVILARAGLLKDKSATVFPSEEKELEKNGAKYIGEKVVIAERIVTANGPDASEKFANAIVRSIIHSKGPTTSPEREQREKTSEEHHPKSCPHHKGE